MILVVAAAPGVSSADQIPFSQFKWLRSGMDKGEVIVRAGQPDSISISGEITVSDSVVGFDTGSHGHDVVGEHRVQRTLTLETWRYVPAVSEVDPFLTVIMFRGEKVWDIHREKVFSSSKASVVPPVQAQPPSPNVPPPSQADVVLRAAQEYARIRAKLKSELAKPAAGGM